LTPAYGAKVLPDYQKGKWSGAAFLENGADLSTRLDSFMADHAGVAGDVLDFGTRMQCTWRDAANYKESDWFKFQEAVLSDLNECWGVLAKRFPDILAR
jgi:hypothetical protein